MSINGMSETEHLKGEEAKALWKEGVDVWNQWVKENPEADVSFANVEFDEKDIAPFGGKKSHKIHGFSFSGFNFPNGKVDFFGASFGDQNVFFSGANFGDGDVDFRKVSFGNGNVDFTKARFGRGSVDFALATFGKGDVLFRNADFGEGSVFFSDTDFGEGRLDFSEANFGIGQLYFDSARMYGGDLSFIGTKFGDGNVSFSSTKFRIKRADFHGAVFGSGSVNFSFAHLGEMAPSFTGVKFGEGDAYFYRMIFGKGSCSFENSSFGHGRAQFYGAVFKSESVNFNRAEFNGSADFEIISITANCLSFSFNKAKFEGPFSLSFTDADAPYRDRIVELNFVPDLINTKTSHHVDLHQLRCKPRMKKESIEVVTNKTHWVGKLTAAVLGKRVQKVADPLDVPRLTRLKELSEGNKSHDAALRFHGQEMRATRWAKETTLVGGVLDYLFDKTSDYGRLIGRPFGLLLAVIAILVGVTAAFAEPSLLAMPWGDVVTLALSKTLPLIGGIVAESKSASEELKMSEWYVPVSAIFSLFSFVFLFLIGLGLRNRFRI